MTPANIPRRQSMQRSEDLEHGIAGIRRSIMHFRKSDEEMRPERGEISL
jgi:hypothetical protein